MTVEQFVMAYGAEQDRLRALLPEGFASLRPVLRINAEVRDGKTGALEFNTAAEKADNRGWVNIGRWDDVPFTKDGKKTTFTLPELMISFTGVGIEGGCPAEKDNVGCYYLKDGTFTLVPAEKITANKEFCDCEFAWRFAGGTHGVSLGKTLPAIPKEETTHYEKAAFTVENAAVIPCMQVLGGLSGDVRALIFEKGLAFLPALCYTAQSGMRFSHGTAETAFLS